MIESAPSTRWHIREIPKNIYCIAQYGFSLFINETKKDGIHVIVTRIAIAVFAACIINGHFHFTGACFYFVLPYSSPFISNICKNTLVFFTLFSICVFARKLFHSYKVGNRG